MRLGLMPVLIALLLLTGCLEPPLLRARLQTAEELHQEYQDKERVRKQEQEAAARRKREAEKPYGVWGGAGKWATLAEKRQAFKEEVERVQYWYEQGEYSRRQRDEILARLEREYDMYVDEVLR